MSEGNNPTGTARRRSTAEIESSLADMLVGTQEQPEEDSSIEEQPSTDSLEKEQELQETEAELTDDSVVDEQDAEEPVDEQLDDDTELFTVTIEGEDREVPLNELISGYHRHATYTQKSQQLAQERSQLEEQLKAIEPERQALRSQYHEYAEVLDQLQQFMTAAGQPANIDWDTLERENPVEWLRLKEHERQREHEVRAVREERVRMQDILNDENTKDMQERMSSEKILMLEKIPEWKDAEVQLEDQKKMVEYGRSLGFTDEELNMIYDHRALLALYKSWKFDQLMNGDKVQAAKSKIGSVKSGNRETVRHTRSRKQKAQRAKLKETGKVEDAAALFSQMLAE